MTHKVTQWRSKAQLQQLSFFQEDFKNEAFQHFARLLLDQGFTFDEVKQMNIIDLMENVQEKLGWFGCQHKKSLTKNFECNFCPVLIRPILWTGNEKIDRKNSKLIKENSF